MIFEDPEGKTLYFPAGLTLGGPDLRAAYVDSLKMNHLMSFTSPVPGAAMHHRRRHSQRGIA
jgi:gluconolactonase